MRIFNMKKSTQGTLLLVTTALALGGCGKKDDAVPAANSTPANPPATTETAATPAPTPTLTTPTPVPTTEANPANVPAPPPPAFSAAAIKQRQELVVRAEAQLKKVKTPKTNQEKFDRNLNWLTLIQHGDRAKREEVMKQIREAGLSPQEAAELETLRKYYNVKF